MTSTAETPTAPGGAARLLSLRFVLVTAAEKAEAAAAAVTGEFDRFIPEYYNEVDRKRGFITTMDRKNKTRDFPIMSLTVAIVAPRTQQKHYAKIVESAAELKRYAKDMGNRTGSIYVRDRRL